MNAKLLEFNYIKATCYKKMKKYDEATELYIAHMKSYEILENKQLGYDFFALLFMPSLDDRRMITNILENVYDYLQMHGNRRNDKIRRPLTGPKDCFYVNKEWVLPEEAVKELHKRSFFKRFRIDDLYGFMPHMKVAQFQVNDIIYLEERACVILSGSV